MTTLAIPQKGRTLEQVLGRLADIGSLKRKDTETICSIMRDDKERIEREKQEIADGERRAYSPIDDIDKTLAGIRSRTRIGHTLEAGYDALRKDQPARILFRGMDIKINGLPARLIGRSHLDIPTTLRNHTAAIGFVGWDGIYADHIDHLTKKDIAEWGLFDEYLRRDSTDVRIIGSAGLQDYTGHFLMVDDSIASKIACIGDFTSHNSRIPAIYDENLKQLGWEKAWHNNSVYVEHNYVALYSAIMENNWWDKHFVGSHNVEADIADNKGIGIYIVQTGKSAKKQGLHIVGLPLLISETVIAVNSEELRKDKDATKVVEAFEPLNQLSNLSQTSFIRWLKQLHGNMGDNYRFVRESMLFGSCTLATHRPLDLVLSAGLAYNR